MKVFKCDRCGRYFDHNTPVPIVKDKKLFRLDRIRCYGTDTKKYPQFIDFEFCDECFDDFVYSFLLTGKKEEEKNHGDD